MYLYNALRVISSLYRNYQPYRFGISGHEIDNSGAMQVIEARVVNYKADEIGRNQPDVVSISNEGRQAAARMSR